MKKTLAFFLVLIAACATTPPPRAENKARCPVCGMNFLASAKTSFLAHSHGEKIQVCSFSCAHRFHKKRQETSFEVKDYLTGEFTGASHAYFLIKSRNLLKELDFDMPPSVVAFSTETDAKKTQSRLGDGEIAHSFEALEKAYE